MFIRTGVFLAAVAAWAATGTIARSEVKIAGPIEYGQPSGPVQYSGHPRFQGFEFNARPGEKIEVTVLAKSGHMQAYLVDSEYQSLAGGGPHFSATIPETSPAGTYYILITETRHRPSIFTLDLERPTTKP